MPVEALTSTLTSGANLINAASSFTTAALAFLPGLIGAAAVLAKYFPPPEPGTFLARLHRWVNVAGQNSGYAENLMQNSSQEPKT